MTSTTDKQRPRWSRALRVLLAVLVIAASSIAGGAIALRVSDEGVYATSAGQLNVDIKPALRGQVELFVPIVDWQLIADAYDAPVTVSIEARSIERSAALEALANPNDVDTTLRAFRAEARDVIHRAVRSAVYAAGLGMLVGALIGAALVTVVSLRRRWMFIGAVQGAIIAVLVIVPTLLALRSLDESSFAKPQYEGQATEVPSLVAFAQQLLVVGGEYKGHYETALRGVTNALQFSAEESQGAELGAGADHSVVLGSDIHNNVFVLDAFAKFADTDPVVLAGDFGQVGSKLENRMVPQIADIGDDVTAVSGNHDSATFMDELVDEGVTVLTKQGVLGAEEPDSPYLTIDGLRVAGYDDPLEGDTDDDAHPLRVYGSAYQRQVDDFLEWFDALPTVPNVVIVHQHGLGRRLLEHLADQGIERVTILAGHDHRAHVDQLGTNVLVDGGSLGAGGPFAIGEQDASFARVHFRGTRAYAADLVAIEPLSGRGVARRIVFEPSTTKLIETDVTTQSE